MTHQPSYWTLSNGQRLAYHYSPGAAPGVVFLGGFRSDMTGSKALALEAYCQARGQAFLRFDYRGHGQSDGQFCDGTIGAWASDAIAIVDAITSGPLVLIGSSMGGWISLLTALARPQRVVGLIGIASAPDFTEDLIWQGFSAEEQARVLREGYIGQACDAAEGDNYSITRALIEDGRQQLLLRKPIALHCPVRLIHGQCDADVPWQTSLRIAEQLQSSDVRVTLIKDGEHRLSRDSDLALLTQTLEGLLAVV